MNTAIRIGLTYTGSEAKHNNYVDWLKGNDNIEIIKLSAEDNNLELVKHVDALVLSGGIDTHPRYYGSDVLDYPNAPAIFNEARDEFEIAVFKLGQEKEIPTLCICRGMQLVNCLLGGDLIQDMGEANDLHRSSEADEKHDVIVLPNTLLSSIVHTRRDNANSAHHQCVDTLGDGLMVNAISEDGVVEGFEWQVKEHKPFLLGVQWHPERMYKLNIQDSTLSKNIREYFIRIVSENKLSKD